MTLRNTLMCAGVWTLGSLLLLLPTAARIREDGTPTSHGPVIGSPGSASANRSWSGFTPPI